MENQIFIHESSFETARKKIHENKDKQIIFSSNDDELNRKILEKEDINVLLLNQASRKDFQKQRNSGFNQVLAKLAKKKDVVIGINLNEVINAGNKKIKSEILARIRQNIMLCNKNKIKMIFIGQKRNPYDLKSLGLVLGMPTGMTREL
ncbi:hypothetical protein COU58_04565 [Candidatus Pacearchaeota archaeon CG10_big_fil_rev_8_21_14_0_10_32_42]|nr:MAG: hypothetical protein COU58_04565 [Candidatus Pacearchaeota archaeon CG10_big_fil_rev_8_21_14_0_10_32_42]